MSTVADLLRAAMPRAPDRPEWTAKVSVRDILGQRRMPVGDSPDLRRIFDLPRRPMPDLSEDADGNPLSVEGMVLVQTALARFGRAPRLCKCAEMARPFCIKRPFALQAWTWQEATLADGVLAPQAVGSGKSFVSIMLALALSNVRTCVLCIPSTQKNQLRGEYLAVAEHFDTPSIVMDDWSVMRAGRPVIHVVPYSILCREEYAGILLDRRPDMFVFDEAQRLRDPNATQTKRVMTYMMLYPTTRVCAMSGTLISKSVNEIGPMAAYTLKERSPYPLDPAVMAECALAVDPSSNPAAGGRLSEMLGLSEDATPEQIRVAWRSRAVESFGVVASAGASVAIPLRVQERKPPRVPDSVRQALITLREESKRPDGEELVDELEITRVGQEISVGFYNRWRFPHNDTTTEAGRALIQEWFDRRQAWNREMRQKLQQSRPFLDSPALLEKASIRAWANSREPNLFKPGEDMPNWKARAWPAWFEIRDKVIPVSDPVWIDDWLARDAAAWALETRGVVWCQHTIFGRRVAELLGVPYYAGGANGGGLLDESGNVLERGDRPVVLSIKAHGTGRNGLQFLFDKQLLANPVSSGQSIEQVLGRLLRRGQRAREVYAFFYRHTRELAKAVGDSFEKAAFIDGLLHVGQKLVGARVDF